MRVSRLLIDSGYKPEVVGAVSRKVGVRVPGQDAKPVRQRKRYTQEDLRRR